MPIKPANRSLYPRDWPMVSEAAKVRAGWQCTHVGADGQRCTACQYGVGRWLPGPGGVLVWTPRHTSALSYAQARYLAAEYSYSLFGDEPVPRGQAPVIVIVLTTAHLDHDPTNCADDNLAPMCQRHHLAWDAAHHAESAYMSRMAQRNNLELPLAAERGAA